MVTIASISRVKVNLVLEALSVEHVSRVSDLSGKLRMPAPQVQAALRVLDQEGQLVQEGEGSSWLVRRCGPEERLWAISELTRRLYTQIQGLAHEAAALQAQKARN